ncbi:MAG: flagellar export chaperone FliS [Planctomycetes bacterium]|nr:flagellar export chaperone FliS [Planctomycetota bacterium]
MADSGDNPYLRNAVMTARPEQLQLMLYDGAIRFASQAREAIEKREIENSFNLLTRAQNIVREMENGLRHEVAPEICAQMASLYRFVFSRLVDANVNKDVQAVDDALKVLRHQRETWAILADKIQKAQSDESPVMQQAEGVETPQDSISLEG